MDEKYWNEKYYKNLEESQMDFLKDTWMEKYKEIICNVENKNALDLGCGLGQDTNFLMKNGFLVTSCDFSRLALTKLKEYFPTSKTLKMNILDGLPFLDNSIGLVNANLSLHYFSMEKTKEIFEDIYRVLEPNGLFIGRMNSSKNNYIDENWQKLEKNFYYDAKNEQHKRLFDQEQFEILTKNWNVVLLKEVETIRKGMKKYTWEFILKK